ncbi:MAG: single-stranded-DNA-specific exonuclease RecJ [Clostridiales bacterium]|nr:single-stranded-DNA-specific exonuclease RecJ [Clostridiales bacterium]
MEKWMVAAKRADFNAIGKKFGIDPVIARLIRNRNVVGEEAIGQYLHGRVEDLPSPHRMKDLELACEILGDSISFGEKIRILGDYDIDGVISTYILLKGLRRLGAEVDTYIPDRVTDGYGIHSHLISKAAEDGVDLIVTCDNGISAVQEIKMAKDMGISVIVTDHHEVPYQEREDGSREWILPCADAIVNPKQPDCPYPDKNLCGAAVAYKLICQLYEIHHIPAEELEEYIELTAFATVGDVMELQGENRILVKEGLRRLPDTKNYGLRELIRANDLENRPITAYHVGFVLGPCINASGRLDTAARSLALLDAKDPQEAARLAGDLTALNQSRKALTERGQKEAMELVETTEIGNDRVLVIFLPDCHESLAGIIAGRVREKYHKPVFVLTRGESFVKGSGRSIESYSMYDELIKCGDLLEEFGGHPMAAGLSLREENVDEFRRRINESCTLTEEDLTPRIVIDATMPISYVTKDLVRQISLLEPFGKGNTRPLFAQKRMSVLNGRVFGKNHNVARFQLMDENGYAVAGIYFGEAEAFLRYAGERKTVSVTYYPEINSYRGRETLQMTVQNYM